MYRQQTWVDDDTSRPLSAARLSHLERGLAVPYRGVVSMSWDDGYDICMTLADEAEARDQRMTFFIYQNVVGQAGYLTEAQIVELHDRGHEIGSHSVTHADMTSLTSAQRTVEFDQSKAYLENLIGAPVVSWTYPYGARNATTDRELWGRYQNVTSLAGGWSPGAMWPLDGSVPIPFHMARYDWGAGGATAVGAAMGKALVRLASSSRTAVQLYAHRPGAGGIEPVLQDVLDTMDLAQQMGVPGVPTRDVFAARHDLLNASFEDGTLDGWDTSLSTGTASVVTTAVATGIGGTRAAQLDQTNTAGWAVLSQIVPVRPGVTYTASGQMKCSRTSGTGGVYFRVRGIDAARTEISQAAGTAYATNTWATQSVDYTPPAGAMFAYVDVLTTSMVGTAWADHIHFGAKALGVHG